MQTRSKTRANRVCLDVDLSVTFIDAYEAERARHEVGDEDDTEGAELSSSAPPPVCPLVGDDLAAWYTDQNADSAPIPIPPSSSTMSNTSRPGVEQRRKADYRKHKAKVKKGLAKHRGSHHIDQSSHHSIDFDIRNLGASGGGGYIGKRDRIKSQGLQSAEWLIQHENYTMSDFTGEDGINEVVTDRNGIIMMVAVCPPAGDTSWAPVCDQAHNAMSKVSVLNNQVKLVPDSKLSHRRGSFLAVNAGMSFGGGQKRPGNLVHPKKLHKVLDDLRKDEGIKRIAGLQASILQTYAPKIHRKMAETITALEEDNPNLQRNFPNSPFAAAAYNCGPKTSCVSHADYGNAAGFFCVITACGQFPAASGAHFVNHTLKRIYRFPAGCSMIVLSASCRHGNTPLPPGFNRTSFTQFFAGGLLRWVDFGCQSVKSLLATEGGKQKKKEIEGEAGERAGRMLGLISRFSEVKDDLEALYPTAGS